MGEGVAGIFHYEDVDGAVARMRVCLRQAIIAAGGQASEGLDRSGARPLPGCIEGEVAPHLPDIIHSTVLRWKGEPTDRAVAIEAFDRIAATWTPMNITVLCACACFEDVPFMHMAGDDAHIWWK